MKNKISKKAVILISIAIMVLGSVSLFAQVMDMVMAEDADMAEVTEEADADTAEDMVLDMEEVTDIMVLHLLKSKLIK